VRYGKLQRRQIIAADFKYCESRR